MLKKQKKPYFRLLSVLALLIFCFSSFYISVPGAPGAPKAARPSVNGRLHVSGSTLVDENGQKVVLRGLSTHGLTWFPDFVNEGFFRQLSENWDCSLIRLAMYSDIYCSSDKDRELSLQLMEKGLDAAIANDMYVIADWHVLSDNNPLVHKEEALEFFRMISEKYSGSPNIIYEICNEPNGMTTWADIRSYASEIIPVIRQNDPDSVILVGTPNFDRDLMIAARQPLPFEQLMYSCHFYASSHYDALQGELEAALEAGLPVFITESGLSEESGDGNVDFKNAEKWYSILRDHDLSFTIWSLSNKRETSSLFRVDYEPELEITEQDLTTTGLWVKRLISGEDPHVINQTDYSGDKSFSQKIRDLLSTSGRTGMYAANKWRDIAKAVAVIALLIWLFLILSGRNSTKAGRPKTYDEIYARVSLSEKDDKSGFQKIVRRQNLVHVALLLSTFFSLMYLCWRVMFSLPTEYGWFAVAMNILLLVVEIFGFLETQVHFMNMLSMRKHPLPSIGKDEYPDVDIFIATYNESVDLLRRTVNGCTHLKYPDKSKVHIWICDDNRRKEMRELAEKMGVGYFDRPDNKGAKAGNLNNALAQTHAPYIVTLDADMIPRSNFLLKTIPYFVDAEKRCEKLPENERTGLGLLQTPQCFYDPDVFQHALYCEREAPNEQDFFYRSVEVAKTASNSVIYGGSNTVLSRKALEAIGGFYTESITEDFATGLLIESAGFVSLAIPEPLASGLSPHTFKEHINQRTRWGRGVIVTARKLKIWSRKNLTLRQKINYWSSVVYWYSSIKNLIYIISPLLFAVFAVPVFRCSWLELLIYWMPMFLMQDICLRLVSGNRVSTKWSGIYETCVMPYMLVPVLKEFFGVTLSVFKVTDKSGTRKGHRKRDWRTMAPFLVLIALSIAGIIRVILIFGGLESVGLILLLFWMIRNMYYLQMAVFLVDGRDEDGEHIHVYAGEFVSASKGGDDNVMEGITTHMTEHNISFLLDEGRLEIGDSLTLTVEALNYQVELTGVVISLRRGSAHDNGVYTMEILDFSGSELEYLQILYDRVPTLPQTLNRDYDIIQHLWVNVAHRVSRTGRSI